MSLLKEKISFYKVPGNQALYIRHTNPPHYYLWEDRNTFWELIPFCTEEWNDIHLAVCKEAIIPAKLSHKEKKALPNLPSAKQNFECYPEGFNPQLESDVFFDASLFPKINSYINSSGLSKAEVHFLLAETRGNTFKSSHSFKTPVACSFDYEEILRSILGNGLEGVSGSNHRIKSHKLLKTYSGFVINYEFDREDEFYSPLILLQLLESSL
jgi:hypothetical protein